MKKIVYVLFLTLISFNTWAKDVKINEIKNLLEDRGYSLKLKPDSKAYIGQKNKAASVLIFPDDNNNIKGIMFAIDTNKDTLLSQEAMLTAMVILPKLVSDSEKASEFFANCFIESETKSKQEIVIENKNFSFYILGNLVMMNATNNSK